MGRPVLPMHEYVATLATALQFYARPENWQSPSDGFAPRYDPEPSPIEADEGNLARGILATLPSPDDLIEWSRRIVADLSDARFTVPPGEDVACPAAERYEEGN